MSVLKIYKINHSVSVTQSDVSVFGSSLTLPYNLDSTASNRYRETLKWLINFLFLSFVVFPFLFSFLFFYITLFKLTFVSLLFAR